MKIIIVRHGQTIENTEGIIQGHRPGTLSENGKKQAKKLGKQLSTEKIQAIYCSDLSRARDTASEIIKYHQKTPIKYLEIIRERKLGDFEGRKIDDIKKEAGSDDSIHFLPVKNAESLEDLFTRGRNVLQILRAAHPDDTVLLITHGGFGKSLISILENQGIEGYSTLPSLHNSGISVYEINDQEKAVKISFNNIDHLS